MDGSSGKRKREEIREGKRQVVMKKWDRRRRGCNCQRSDCKHKSCSCRPQTCLDQCYCRGRCYNDGSKAMTSEVSFDFSAPKFSIYKKLIIVVQEFKKKSEQSAAWNAQKKARTRANKEKIRLALHEEEFNKEKTSPLQEEEATSQDKDEGWQQHLIELQQQSIKLQQQSIELQQQQSIELQQQWIEMRHEWIEFKAMIKKQMKVDD